MNRFILAFMASVAALVLAAPASALSGPLNQTYDQRIQCGTSATLIQFAEGQVDMRCYPESGTVYFGGPTVTTEGYGVGVGVPDPALTITARKSWCVAAAPTFIRCIYGR